MPPSPASAARSMPSRLAISCARPTNSARYTGDLAAGAKEIPPSGWRLTKVSPREHIDAAIALAMAAQIAESEWSLGGPSFAETGGIWSLDLTI